MATLRKTVRIPSDHRIRLDLAVPEDIPPGDAEVLVVISAVKPAEGRQGLARWAGRLAKSRTFAGDPVAIQRSLRDEW